MTNQVERCRVEADEDSQGGWVSFDWTTGVMSAVWDSGATETWPRRGYSIETKANSFFLMTDQLERMTDD
jgi:hypothetical protein